MDFDDAKVRAAFFELHSGLPREAPGNRESTGRALALAGPLPSNAKVLDIGCGPGAQSLDLAELLPQAEVLAVDTHEPFVAEANRRARSRGLAGRVRAVWGDMTAIDLDPAGFDLLWCEGAAYIMGVGKALTSWRRLLKPGGKLALSDAVWLRPDPPQALRRFWDADYPAMGDLASGRALIAASGYRLLGDFVLPEEAWWDGYYGPLESRIHLLEARYAGDAAGEAVLREARREVDFYRRYAAYYGYAFFVMAAPADVTDAAHA